MHCRVTHKMNIKACKIINILLSKTAETIGPNNVATGIYKKSITKSIDVTKTGLFGDITVDKRVHGGLEKAIYQYPSENYEILKKFFPHLSEKFNTPSVGENFSSIGLTEKEVNIGDIFSIGKATIQVSQPRMPCWKLNHKIGNAHIAKLFITQSITGWYYRVISEGKISVGDKLILKERLDNSVSIFDLWILWVKSYKNHNNKLINIPGISPEWTFKD